MKVVMEHEKNWPEVMEFCDQSGNLPILPLNCTKFDYSIGHHQEIKQRSRKSAFSDVFRKTSQMQNREEK